MPVVGASGAIGGVMGAYAVLYPRAPVHMLVALGFFFTRIVVPAYLMLGYWFLLQLLGGIPALHGAGGGVAFWAHVGGFAAGDRVASAVPRSASASRRTAATSPSTSRRCDRRFAAMLAVGEGTSVVTIGMNYSVLPGKEKIFEDACDRVVETMQGIDGHDESHLYRRIDGNDARVSDRVALGERSRVQRVRRLRRVQEGHELGPREHPRRTAPPHHVSGRVNVPRPVVVGLGLCVVDHLYVVDELAGRSERARYVRAPACETGGMASNALAQAARLGCRAELISLVGDDAEGPLAAAPAARGGVVDAPARALARIPDHDRGRDDPARATASAASSPRTARRSSGASPTSISRRSGAGRVLLIDGHFPAQALRAARRARALGVPGGRGPQRSAARLPPPAALGGLRRSLPEAFVRQWSPGDPARRAAAPARRVRRSPVVTLGARGGLYWHDGQGAALPQPARARARHDRRRRRVPRRVRGRMAHGLPLPEIVARAARAGALACTAIGATARLATRREWDGRASSFRAVSVSSRSIA